MSSSLSFVNDTVRSTYCLFPAAFSSCTILREFGGILRVTPLIWAYYTHMTHTHKFGGKRGHVFPSIQPVRVHVNVPLGLDGTLLPLKYFSRKY